MSKTTRATVALDKVGINFTLHSYDYDPDAERVGLQAAETLGIGPRRLLKTVMVEVDGAPRSRARPCASCGRGDPDRREEPRLLALENFEARIERCWEIRKAPGSARHHWGLALALSGSPGADVGDFDSARRLIARGAAAGHHERDHFSGSPCRYRRGIGNLQGRIERLL
jgi:hypothetical protein